MTKSNPVVCYVKTTTDYNDVYWSLSKPVALADAYSLSQLSFQASGYNIIYTSGISLMRRVVLLS